MEIVVNLGPRSYPIRFEKSGAANLPSTLKTLFPKSRFALVTNKTIARLYRDLVDGWVSELSCPVHEMEDGEQYKTIGSWSGILDFLLREKFERSSVVIALGGGVVGDVAGFAAASFLRGVGFVQVPTTLLSMVDSSVGGKTAVDHPLGKNLIGAFHQPKLVMVDSAFLDTLPEREFLSGYAELFKCAYIGGREMFDFVVRNHVAISSHGSDALPEGISRSVAIKAAVVEKDEHETSGLRALLNFGHTFAHALERYFNFESILHGEAVWWGMHCAVECAKQCNMIERAALSDYAVITHLMPKPPLPASPDPQRLYEMMFTDKKVADGKLRLVLPTSPGSSTVCSDVGGAVIKAVTESVFG